jgi:cobalt-zinc-cadmium efflux system membrane fusion protein
MMKMFQTKNFRLALLGASFVLAAVCIGCGRSSVAVNANVSAAPTPSGQSNGVELEIVQMQPIEGSLTATGKVLAMEDKTATLGPVHDGRIVNFYAGQGSVVHKGQRLADLESADIDEAEADYLKALNDLENASRTSAAEVKFNQATYDRTKLLVEKEISPAKNLQQAEHDLDVAKANAANSISTAKVELENAKRHLMILGMSEAAVGSLGKSQNFGKSTFPLNAPISGTVVERDGSIGATVGSDANVFKITDLSSVWIDANVFEKDLNRIRMGESVKVTVPALPDHSFVGRVILINSIVDPDTRTVKVRTEVANPGGELKPDMFANVEIVTAAHTTAITIPLASVLDDGGKSVVFVATDKGYDKREVTLGLKSDDRVEISQGLSIGDKVVTKGNYLLMEQSKGGEGQ